MLLLFPLHLWSNNDDKLKFMLFFFFFHNVNKLFKFKTTPHTKYLYLWLKIIVTIYSLPSYMYGTNYIWAVISCLWCMCNVSTNSVVVVYVLFPFNMVSLFCILFDYVGLYLFIWLVHSIDLNKRSKVV